MNMLMWVLPIALAALYVSGGAYKVSKSADLQRHVLDIPRAAWRTLGAIELLGGLLLVIPASVTGQALPVPVAAAVLAAETLLLAGPYARKSLALVASNPLVCAAPMAVLAAFVAYGRYALA